MRFLMFGLILLFSSGCATPKQWDAISGSRSDGTIRLGFHVGPFEKPQLKEGQAERLAGEKCRVWGYSGAQLFGSVMQKCTANNQYGCVAWFIYADYQCVSHASVAPIAPVDSFGPRISSN